MFKSIMKEKIMPILSYTLYALAVALFIKGVMRENSIDVIISCFFILLHRMDVHYIKLVEYINDIKE